MECPSVSSRPVTASQAKIVKSSRVLSEWVSAQATQRPPDEPSAWSVAGSAKGWIFRRLPLARFSAATPEKPRVQADTYAVVPLDDIPSGTTSPWRDSGTGRPRSHDRGPKPAAYFMYLGPRS